MSFNGGPNVQTTSNTMLSLQPAGSMDQISNSGITFPAQTPGMGVFNINIPAPQSYLGVPDDQVDYGYNRFQDAALRITSEPTVGFNLEVNYQITAVRGAAGATRTVEQYETYTPQSNTGNGVESRQWFTSYVPDSENGGANPFINYSYIMTGSNKVEAVGGGGVRVLAGSNPLDNNVFMGIDSDGVKNQKAIYVQPLSYVTYSGVTNNTTTAITLTGLPTGHGFKAGGTVVVYTVNTTGATGYTAANGPYRISAVAATTITMVTPLSPTVATTGAIAMGAAIDASIASKKIGAGRAIPDDSAGTVFEAGGYSSFFGGVSIVEAAINGTAQADFHADGQLSFVRGGSGNQFLNFTTSGVFQWALGYLKNSPNNSLGIGPFQSTDANFTQANSWLSISPNGMGVGGTSAAGAVLRLYNGTITSTAGQYGHIQMEPFTANTANTGSACVLTFDGTTLKARVGTTDKTIATWP